MSIKQDLLNPSMFVGSRMHSALYESIDFLNPDAILVVCDTNTFKYCFPLYNEVFSSLKNCKVISIHSGEESKSIKSSGTIWEALLELKGGRNSLVIALGGGMVCDLVGFSASVFMRGIPYILMPTSLLGMIDAAIGGKTAINYNELKNPIGTFTSADFIIADYDFLKTLSQKEFNSGKAEMLKHSLLEGEEAFNNFLKAANVGSAEILKSMLFKQKIVEEDFKETGIREVLNLGHTIAHSLESLFLKRAETLLHGEAVAAGLWIEAQLAERFFKLESPWWVNSLQAYIKQTFGKVSIVENEIPYLIQAMSHDKKNKSGKQSFVLLKFPGEISRGMLPDESLLKDALLHYINYA